MRFLGAFLMFAIISILIYSATNEDLHSFFYGLPDFFENKILFTVLSIPFTILIQTIFFSFIAVYFAAVKYFEPREYSIGILFLLGPIGLIAYYFYVIMTLDLPLFYRTTYTIVSLIPLLGIASAALREKYIERKKNTDSKTSETKSDLIEATKSKKAIDVPDVVYDSDFASASADKLYRRMKKESDRQITDVNGNYKCRDFGK